MQYFLGYLTSSSEPPFYASLFVEIRKRLGMETINQINERIVQLKNHKTNRDEGYGRIPIEG